MKIFTGFIPPDPNPMRINPMTVNAVAGKFKFGMALIDIRILPDAYTHDKYKIVLNLPRKLSANNAPKTGNKYTSAVKT
jgi:hypothetical protein